MSNVGLAVPPQSRFATYTDEISDTSVIDWEQVGTEEPEQIVKWIGTCESTRISSSS